MTPPILLSLSRRRLLLQQPVCICSYRYLSSGAPKSAAPGPISDTPPPRTTHFKITLRRSAIGLGDAKKGTIVSLGLHRRHQTVYHRHSPEAAGKILAVKELLEVENVPEEFVRTKEQQTLDRRATRGYQVVGSRRGELMNLP